MRGYYKIRRLFASFGMSLFCLACAGPARQKNEKSDTISVAARKKREGPAYKHYSDGRLLNVANYSDGLLNGYNSCFDSSGNCYYRDFYYYGLNVGPVTLFFQNGNPKLFFFTNLQNETLLKIDYRSWNGIRDVHTGCINFTCYPERVDTTHELAVLLYLIKPPRFSFDFSILKRMDTSWKDMSEVMKVEDTLPFKNIILPVLPEGQQYVIGLKIYDSLLHKHNVIYKDLYKTL
jgi:hypothetical protein